MAEVSGLLIYTRPGFEGEACAEILAKSQAIGITGHVKAREAGGVVMFFPQPPEALGFPPGQLRYRDLVFARQLIFLIDQLELPAHDRILPILESLKRQGCRCSRVFLETADTNEAKELASLLRKFERPLVRTLKDQGILQDGNHPRLHVFFESGSRALLGLSCLENAAEPAMGIPRLRFPSGAPSRSTLKLDEAFRYFIENPEDVLKPGMTAVDLGAAPGGWTFQLVRRHIHTVAVDNGPMADALLESGLVEHLRVDGFRYRPPRPVDWLVCDMVEQPERVARLVASWLARGDCQRAIFNLKLPMKKRWQMVESCTQLIHEELGRMGMNGRLSFKQLYHDRAEITGYLERA